MTGNITVDLDPQKISKKHGRQLYGSHWTISKKNIHLSLKLFQGVPASSGLILSKKVEFWKCFELQAPLEIQGIIE